MTKEEVLAMKPGQELDALVIKTLWWDLVKHDEGGATKFFMEWCNFHPSTDFSAAGQVVNKMTELPSVKGTPPTLFTLQVGKYPAPWAIARFGEVEAVGEFATEAICKAALIALICGRGKGD